ncbi:MAG: hypothetical protein WC869_00005 [Phycisphaerae bacterium]|jgi:hypothetical protein
MKKTSVSALKTTKPARLTNTFMPVDGNVDDLEYVSWIHRMQLRFQNLVGSGDVPLFEAEIDDLFAIYLSAIPAAQRQYHNCGECRRFINRFGTLLYVDDKNHLRSAIWDVDDAPEFYKPVVYCMIHAVVTAGIRRVFYSSERHWGTARTGAWTHFALAAPVCLVHNERARTAGQKMAEKVEDFKTMQRALLEFSYETVIQATGLLKSEALYRAEKVLGPCEWLLDLMTCVKAAEGAVMKEQVLWKAVATAPAGFCHPRSSMVGTLLEDLQAGKSVADAARSFAAKMHPLLYQRPQAAPAAGTIAQAEKLVEKLGIEPSLKRRFATPDDVSQAIWRPQGHRLAQAGRGGVFGHLKAKNKKHEPPMTDGALVTMTWDKFVRTLLPEAYTIDLLVPSMGNFTVLVTAEDMTAPPILQWDTPEERNPVSQYVWDGGSPANQFGLYAGRYAPLWAISENPSMWGGKCENQGKGVILLIEGAHESRQNGGLAIFPETLKSELHGVRSVVEAFSREGKLGNPDGEHAVGICLSAGQANGRSWNTTIRVQTSLGYQFVNLDRWD